jgi:deoxyribodipyrimidine photo-lyase
LSELAAVSTRHIYAPWLMTAAEQRACGITIGRDYPAPVVDHAQARKAALEMYGKVKRREG